MRILAITAFDPASVVLSHRDLMRGAGHDFRLASVRAYTERQQAADYVLERLVSEDTPLGGGALRRESRFERLTPNLEELRGFAASADVIQFHPGIGRGDGDWASDPLAPNVPYVVECDRVIHAFGLANAIIANRRASEVIFFHGSRNLWANRESYKHFVHTRAEWVTGPRLYTGATSTLDYAYELDASYLPPYIGDPINDHLAASPRGDDDPLVVVHTPTDRAACSTDIFLEAARRAGVVVLLGEGKSHSEIMALKAQANVGFDHLRGAFSTNTLENAALGLVPLFALKPEYREHALTLGFDPLDVLDGWYIQGGNDLEGAIRYLANHNAIETRRAQSRARAWWERHFSAEPITKRLLKFYKGL